MTIAHDPMLAARSEELAHRWTQMWNGELSAVDVVSSGCLVHFGREPRTPRPKTTTGPDELQRVIDGIRESCPGIHYSLAGQPPHHAEGEDGALITVLWNVAVPQTSTRSGIDLLRQRDGVITEVWSITGDLQLPAL